MKIKNFDVVNLERVQPKIDELVGGTWNCLLFDKNKSRKKRGIIEAVVNKNWGIIEAVVNKNWGIIEAVVNKNWGIIEGVVNKKIEEL